MGAGPIGINDDLASPMYDVFDRNRKVWSYRAVLPGILRSTALPLPKPSTQLKESCRILPAHDADYWALAMADQDFSDADAGKFGAGNYGLWRGLKGDVPYPTKRGGEDLRPNRDFTLEAAGYTGGFGCGQAGK